MGASGGSGGRSGSGGAAGASTGGAAGSGTGGGGGIRFTYRDAVMADGPIAYYRLGETTGSVATNEVDPSPTGAFQGALELGAPGAITTDFNTAVLFDPDNSAISVDGLPSFEGKQPFTLEVWIHPTFDTQFHSIVTKWHVVSSVSANGYQLFHDDDRLSFHREAGAATNGDFIDFDGLVDQKYSYVVAVFDGTAMKLYVDAALVMSTTADTPIPPTDTPFMIGNMNDSPTWAPFNGYIDEVAVYAHALLPDQITAHYVAALVEN